MERDMYKPYRYRELLELGLSKYNIREKCFKTSTGLYYTQDQMFKIGHASLVERKLV